MQTTEIIISKANGIRFAKVDGLMNSFDNQLWGDEVWSTKKGGCYKQTVFKDGDPSLLQLKAGLTAVVVVTKYVNGVGTPISPTTTSTYTGYHKIYEYLIAYTTLEEFYLTVSESGAVKHTSETIEVVEDDGSYTKMEWSSDDPNTNTFQFDYTTALSESNVNFILIKAELVNYEPSGEATVYDNQEQKEKIKANYYRKLTLETERIPRQLAEIITLAMQHDYFQINEVPYTVEDYPKIDMLGGFTQLTATLTLLTSEGLDTDDVGYNDADMTNYIMNKVAEGATGAGTFSVTSGYGITQIIAKKLTGTPILKIGETVGAEGIFESQEITNTTPPLTENMRYAPTTSGAWTIYYDVSGGTIDLYIQTIKFTE
jgi:hypothetical protein